MDSKGGSKCPLVFINNVPEEDGQATGLVHPIFTGWTLAHHGLHRYLIHDLSSRSRRGCKLL